ncbi:hypothetical protein AAHH67_02875 [Niallia circulans]
MNQQAFEVLGFYKILEEIESYAKTNLAKKTIRKLRPLQDKGRMEQSIKEIEEAMKIIEISSSVPIHTLDEMSIYLSQAKKGFIFEQINFRLLFPFGTLYQA